MKYTLASFNKELQTKYKGLKLTRANGKSKDSYCYWITADDAPKMLVDYVYTRYTTSVLVASFDCLTPARWFEEADTFMKDFETYAKEKQRTATQAQERCELKRQLRLAGVPFDSEAKLEDLLKLLNFVTKKSNGIIGWRKDAQELSTSPKEQPRTEAVDYFAPEVLSKEVYEACENIDAAIFSGDEFERCGDPRALAELERYVGRWQRFIEEAKKPIPDNSFDDDNGYCRD